MEKVIKIILCLIVTAIISLCIWIYLAFCKFDQIYVGIEGEMITKQDSIFHKKWVLGHYHKTLFLYKGRTFEDIPCYEFKDKTKHYVSSLKFNWDNSITYSIDNKERILDVDSINITSSAYIPIDTIDWLCASDDSIFYSIGFFDKKNNMIEISRQKSNLPYGGKRHGFWIKIGDKNIVTGKTSPFDY